MEVPRGSADLLMECEEEEQVWPPTPEDEGVKAAVSLMENDGVRIIPIPVQPGCPPPHTHTLQPSDGALSFMVNGQLVPLLPGGGGAELKICSRPRGSSRGFTTVQIPVTAPAEPEPTPIITGVVSGEAAQKVLSDHNVNFKPLKTLSKPGRPLTDPGTPSFTSTSGPQRSSGRAAASPGPRHKGHLGPASPPDCPLCVSQYKFITQLRGFMCLCSPQITQSLKSLERRSRQSRWRQKKMFKSSRVYQSNRKLARTRLPAKTHRSSDDFLSDHKSSPQQGRPTPPQGKLVILVEDFYYGSAQGPKSDQSNEPQRKFTGPYHCSRCPRTLSNNNLQLMSHMLQHVSMATLGGGATAFSCPHCFRQFPSESKRRCHVKAVHSQFESTVTCQICELHFDSEPVFLWHMKNTHKPGEMPYVCQVCDFRSSFYSDVWSHFQETHADTKHLLCPYCLRVLHNNHCYQQHLAQHQRKQLFGCDKCRLHFLYIKERMEHKLLHHRTHIRPPQISGLRPGTKLTVRTYSAMGGAEIEEPMKKVSPCKVVDVDPPPPPDSPQRRPVQSLGPLLSGLSPGPAHLCVECLSVIGDYRTHFPSVVHCSLCTFLTCCSTSYANHMISEHVICEKNPRYQSFFKSEPRSAHRMECVSCSLSTHRGDTMANHLTENPEHHCKVHDWSVYEAQQTHNSHSAHGSFVPIHLLSSAESSSKLSVRTLAGPAPILTPPSMTVTFLRPCTQPEQPSLSVSQLAAVLSSLCHGLAQASRRCRTPAAHILSWTQQQQRGLMDRKWSWRTERLFIWLLRRREQQLVVKENVLLQEACGILGKDPKSVECYSWSVNFLLRHDISQQSSDIRVELPSDIKESIHTFIQLQVFTRWFPPHCVGCMDELSIFLDSEAFSAQDPSAFQLCGSSQDKPVFDVVLSALSDGTLLPPLLFFRGASSHLPDGFPDNVLLEAQQEGFTDQKRLHIWINKVWRPRVSAGRSVLVVDVHRGHQKRQFRTRLEDLTDLVLVPLGTSCRLQPLEVCVTPVLRDFLQARWTQLVSQGGLEGLGLDQLALTLACWLSEVCSMLNSETDVLRRSFSSAWDLQQVEDRCQAASMIRFLNESLIQPLETAGGGLRPQPGPEPGPRPGPGSETGLTPELELLLVVEEDKMESGVKVTQVNTS